MLDSGDPTTGGVEFFAVDGWRILFFTPRDHDPVHSRVWHGQVVTGQLVPGARGDVLVPTEQAGTYDERPWVVAT